MALRDFPALSSAFSVALSSASSVLTAYPSAVAKRALRRFFSIFAFSKDSRDLLNRRKAPIFL